MKNILILGGGGFIGGALAFRLKNKQNYWIRIVDIKPSHDFWNSEDICNEYICGDLRDPKVVSKIFESPNGSLCFDEVYQLAADMGGAGYLFTEENDANVMHNSALINLNVAYEASKKSAKKIFYSSSACIYPLENQLDPNNPNCLESSAYPANPDSEYGWEKLFSERMFTAFQKNYGLNVRIARFHNIYGPMGTWTGGKEKVPAAMCRKASETENNNSFEVWGDGLQTRSFLYIEDCIDAILKFMDQETFFGPVNIGSEELVTINKLAKLAIQLSRKKINIKNLEGQEFFSKYGFKCPVGVRGRNSENTLIENKLNWKPKFSLNEGMQLTFNWINEQVKKSTKTKQHYIY